MCPSVTLRCEVANRSKGRGCEKTPKGQTGLHAPCWSLRVLPFAGDPLGHHDPPERRWTPCSAKARAVADHPTAEIARMKRGEQLRLPPPLPTASAVWSGGPRRLREYAKEERSEHCDPLRLVGHGVRPLHSRTPPTDRRGSGQGVKPRGVRLLNPGNGARKLR